MGQTTAGSGLLGDVQRRLALGQSDAEILAELTASGLSRPSAERFLQRAHPVGAPAPALPPPIPFVEPSPPGGAAALDPPPLAAAPAALAAAASTASASTGAAPASTLAWLSVLGAAATLTIGLAAVAWGLSQERNVRLRLPLVIAVTGGAWLLQASRRVVDPRRPATWLVPAAAAIPPLLAFAVVLGTLAAGRPRPEAKAAGAEPSALAVASPARPAGRGTARPPTRDERIAQSVETLEGTRPGDRCGAAQALAYMGASEHASLLERQLSEVTAPTERICLTHALTQLGGGDVTVSHYLAWSESDEDLLRHHAIVGFGHLGPGAASATLPVLERIVEGGASAARRYVVVTTLAKLGPAARPLLQTLAGDDDAQVQAAAQAALRSLP